MYVIKVGGSLQTEVGQVCADVQALVQRGAAVVIVHGGSAEANRLGRQIGHPPRYLTSASGERSRYTDAATLDVLMMAMIGRVKPMIVTQLAALGVRAVGITGLDGGLVTAEKTRPIKALIEGQCCVVRDDLTGRIAAIDTDLLRRLLDGGYLPVVSPPVIDPIAGALNIDADRLAAALAVALGAQWLIVLSNVPGLLRDPEDRSSLVSRLPREDIAHYMAMARGRMRVKLLAAYEALDAGIPHVVLGDGRLQSPVLAACAGQGTTLTTTAPEQYTPALSAIYSSSQ